MQNPESTPKESDSITACKMNLREKGELYYVKTGDIVDFAYVSALTNECRVRGCNVFDLITKGHDAKSIEDMVDWLIKNYPEEFEVA